MHTIVAPLGDSVPPYPSSIFDEGSSSRMYETGLAPGFSLGSRQGMFFPDSGLPTSVVTNKKAGGTSRCCAGCTTQSENGSVFQAPTTTVRASSRRKGSSPKKNRSRSKAPSAKLDEEQPSKSSNLPTNSASDYLLSDPVSDKKKALLYSANPAELFDNNPSELPNWAQCSTDVVQSPNVIVSPGGNNILSNTPAVYSTHPIPRTASTSTIVVPSMMPLSSFQDSLLKGAFNGGNGVVPSGLENPRTGSTMDGFWNPTSYQTPMDFLEPITTSMPAMNSSPPMVKSALPNANASHTMNSSPATMKNSPQSSTMPNSSQLINANSPTSMTTHPNNMANSTYPMMTNPPQANNMNNAPKPNNTSNSHQPNDMTNIPQTNDMPNVPTPNYMLNSPQSNYMGNSPQSNYMGNSPRPNYMGNGSQPNYMSNGSQPNYMSNSAQPNYMSNSAQPNAMTNSAQPYAMTNSAQPNAMNNSAQPNAMNNSVQAPQMTPGSMGLPSSQWDPSASPTNMSSYVVDSVPSSSMYAAYPEPDALYIALDAEDGRMVAVNGDKDDSPTGSISTNATTRFALHDGSEHMNASENNTSSDRNNESIAAEPTSLSCSDVSAVSRQFSKGSSNNTTPFEVPPEQWTQTILWDQGKEISAADLTPEHRILRQQDRVAETVKPRVIREDVTTNRIIMVPETNLVDEVIEETEYVKERIVEIERNIQIENIVEVFEPEEIIHMTDEEVVVEIPVLELHYVDEVHEIQNYVLSETYTERVVEIPEIEIRDIEILRTLEAPSWKEELVITENPVDHYVDVHVPSVKVVRVEKEVARLVPIPIAQTTTIELKLPRVIAVYEKVKIPVYLPRFVEIPIPSDTISASFKERCLAFCDEVSDMAKAAQQQSVSLCKLESVGVEAKQRELGVAKSLGRAMSGQEDRLAALWKSGKLQVRNENSISSMSTNENDEALHFDDEGLIET